RKPESGSAAPSSLPERSARREKAIYAACAIYLRFRHGAAGSVSLLPSMAAVYSASHTMRSGAEDFALSCEGQAGIAGRTSAALILCRRWRQLSTHFQAAVRAGGLEAPSILE